MSALCHDCGRQIDEDTTKLCPACARAVIWRKRFMEMAWYVAKWSKDPSTKVAAIIVGPDNEIRATGYNGFPRGVADTRERYADRDTKIALTVHAECNAIFNAVRSGVCTAGCHMYVAGLPPCSICAGAIVQAGITHVTVTTLDINDIPDRWRKSCATGLLVLRESGTVTLHAEKHGLQDLEPEHGHCTGGTTHCGHNAATDQRV